MKARKPKNQYCLRYRIQMRSGDWGYWHEGFSEWLGIEEAQKKILMLKRSHSLKTLEIQFIHEGELKGYSGEVTGKSIIYEAR